MDALAEARALRQQGRHEDALGAFARAVQEANAAGETLRAAQVRIGEIDSLGMLGRYDEAITLAERLETQLPPRDVARVLGNLGSLYLRRDQYAEALACYERASPLDADPRLHAGLAVNAGITLTHLGREVEAEEHYAQAREIYTTLGSAFDAAVVNTNLGFLSVTAGRYARALALLTEAISVFQSEGTVHEEARAAIDAGETCRALNLLPEALAHYSRAQAIFVQLPLDYDRARAALGQAAIFAQQGRDGDVEAALAQAETLFVAQGNTVQQAHLQLLRALLRQREGREAEARVAALAARAGFEFARLPGWAAEAQLLLGEELESVVALARTTGRVWLESRAERECLTALPQLAKLSELRHAARRFRYHLQKMAGAPALRPLLAPALKTELDAVLGQLYDFVFRPLAPKIHTQRLVIVPTGVLHGLPLAAFRDGDTYLLDQYELVVTPSAAIWHTLVSRRQQSKLRTGPALLVSLHSVGTEQAQAEVEAIAPCLTEVTALSGSAATLTAVREQMKGKAILHFATHALFRQDNPLFSGLQLSEGWLLARDLYGLPLDADLVTLSACQTAVSQIAAGDEPFGLVRGFLAAGAQRVAASLWPADDAATAALMQGFYGKIAQGQTPSQALRAAQQELQALWPHPYYWAAFCLMGSG